MCLASVSVTKDFRANRNCIAVESALKTRDAWSHLQNVFNIMEHQNGFSSLFMTSGCSAACHFPRETVEILPNWNQGRTSARSCRLNSGDDEPIAREQSKKKVKDPVLVAEEIKKDPRGYTLSCFSERSKWRL